MSMIRNSYNIGVHEKTDVLVGSNLLETFDQILRPYAHTGYLLLCDETTQKLYANQVTAALSRLGVPVVLFSLPVGEVSKVMESVTKILDTMLVQNLDRKSAVIALGGGVIGDLATMVSGLYLRGVDCIGVPSTLLAQVDSAFGGKGGVNQDVYKNMIGLTRQPKLVVVDTSLLQSLPDTQIRSGYGEIVKYAVSQDVSLFEKLEKLENNKTDLESTIQTCIDLKMKTVSEDPLDERGARMVLNFGHTLAHAVELTSNLTHGEAVGIGMVFALKVSLALQIVSEEIVNRAYTLIQKYELPTTVGGNREEIKKIMKKDKKNQNATTRLVLLADIGKTVIKTDISDTVIDQVLAEVII